PPALAPSERQAGIHQAKGLGTEPVIGLGPAARWCEERDRMPTPRMTVRARLEQWWDHAEIAHIERAFQLFGPRDRGIPALGQPGGSTSQEKTQPQPQPQFRPGRDAGGFVRQWGPIDDLCVTRRDRLGHRSEEHTSELQSPCNLVCRLLLEKKKKI